MRSAQSPRSRRRQEPQLAGARTIQLWGPQSLPATGFGGDRDAVAAARRAVGMRLSEPRIGPSTRCRRRDYEERLPPLGRWSPSPRHILCNGGLPDIDAELEKLAMNPWCAPQWVGETDLANELTDFQRGLWTATARSRFPAPIRSEAGTMPADHGLRPDDLQSVQQARCQPIQPGKYQTVDAGEA